MVTEIKARAVVYRPLLIALCLFSCIARAQEEKSEEDAKGGYDEIEFDAEYAPAGDSTQAEALVQTDAGEGVREKEVGGESAESARPAEPVSVEPEMQQQIPESEQAEPAPQMTEPAAESAVPGAQEATDLATEEPAKQESAQLEVLEEPKIGIDTRNLAEGQGNWLFKRIWWERAEQKYEKIRKLVESVFEARTLFLAQRADLDKNVLDPFYIVIGFGQRELNRIIDALMQYLERARTDKDGLLDHQQKVLQELRKEETTLRKIKRNIEGIATINQQINDSLNTLLEQINRVRTYEREAWKHFKKIARVLSDTEARTLYYEMDIIAKNIVDIQGYISQDFAYYFGELDTMLKQLVGELQDAIESLKEKGIELHDQLEQLERKPEPCPVVLPEEPEEEKVEAGWLESYILEPIGSVFSGIGSFFGYLYSLVAGGQDAVSEQSDEENAQD